MQIGNLVRPLTNVALLAELIQRLHDRPMGLPGIGVFSGFPGYGKTYAATFAVAKMDAIHISIGSEWTKRAFVKQLLNELNVPARGTTADMIDAAIAALALEDRTLIIDESDFAVQKRWVELLRTLHDHTDVPLVLIGMEHLPQNLRQFPQVSSRVGKGNWIQAQPADLRDTRMIAELYAPDVTISDDLLKSIVCANTGNVRMIATDLAHVQSEAKKLGLREMDVEQWGGLSMLPDTAPVARRGMKW